MEPPITNFSSLSAKPKPVFDLSSQPLLNRFHPISPLKQCPICYSFFSKVSKPDACNHFFCLSCISRWTKFKKQCPLCRAKFKYIIII